MPFRKVDKLSRSDSLNLDGSAAEHYKGSQRTSGKVATKMLENLVTLLIMNYITNLS